MLSVPGDNDMKRKSQVGGAWLWRVPPDTKLEKMDSIPDVGWKFIEMRPGDFGDNIEKAHRALRLAQQDLGPGLYCIGIGQGGTFLASLLTVEAD